MSAGKAIVASDVRKFVVLWLSLETCAITLSFAMNPILKSIDIFPLLCCFVGVFKRDLLNSTVRAESSVNSDQACNKVRMRTFYELFGILRTLRTFWRGCVPFYEAVLFHENGAKSISKLTYRNHYATKNQYPSHVTLGRCPWPPWTASDLLSHYTTAEKPDIHPPFSAHSAQKWCSALKTCPP